MDEVSVEATGPPVLRPYGPIRSQDDSIAQKIPKVPDWTRTPTHDPSGPTSH